MAKNRYTRVRTQFVGGGPFLAIRATFDQQGIDQRLGGMGHRAELETSEPIAVATTWVWR